MTSTQCARKSEQAWSWSIRNDWYLYVRCSIIDSTQVLARSLIVLISQSVYWKDFHFTDLHRGEQKKKKNKQTKKLESVTALSPSGQLSVGKKKKKKIDFQSDPCTSQIPVLCFEVLSTLAKAWIFVTELCKASQHVWILAFLAICISSTC